MINDAKSPSSRLSLWLTRIQAIGFGFLILLLIEVICRFYGFGQQSLGNDPFVGFSALEPLFALNPLTNQYDMRPERRLYFVSNGFPRYKDPKTFRIFVFGGSTVQGRPFSIQTAFPQWLKINLELAYPDRKFEAVNCGGISYASYRLVPIIEECLQYEPDLFILCTGQNEFLEARTYGSLKQIAKHLGGPVKALRSLATYQAMDTGYHRYLAKETNYEGLKKPTMKMEVDALLDYRRGLQAYHRDREWQAGVIAHFDENVRRIHNICKKNGVPLMILNPPVNLKDCPPFKSEPSPDLSPERAREIDEIMFNFREQNKISPIQAAEYLTRLSDVFDKEDASSQYTLGHCYLLLDNTRKAAEHFEKALVEDVCPLRLLPEMRQFVGNFASSHKIPYIDLQSLLLEYSPSPIMGSEMLVDHIHPSIRGHKIIGEAVARLVGKTWIKGTPQPIQENAREEAYQAQMDSLEELYFVHGQMRLDNLMKWTKGESDGLPIEMHQALDPR